MLILYTALYSCANLQSTVLKDDGFGQLGFYILALLYLAMVFGAIVSTAVINKYGTKVCLVAGAIGTTVWIALTLFAARHQNIGRQNELQYHEMVTWILIISTLVNGVTIGALWTAANTYVALCAARNNKGYFFGYFWCFYMTSQICGNFIAALMLGYSN